MNGKDKCRILKEIRRQIAQENDIEWVVSECKHQGNCKGTCPKCESEVRMLEQELSIRRRLGKAVAITGISAACMAGLTACSMEDVADLGEQIIEGVRDLIPSQRIKPDLPDDYAGGLELSGDVYIPDEPITDPEDVEVLDGEVAYYED